MGKLQAFQVRFSTPNPVFFPGSFVSGDLLIQLSEPMNMKAVRIKFVGRAHVHWTESHTTGTGENRRTETRHYSATENLFEQAIIVHGEGSSVGGDSLPQGQHSFPFNFQLPSPLPTSYEDHIGYIRYHVKGTIVKPWKFDHNTKAVFTVLDTLDLNMVPNVMRSGFADMTEQAPAVGHETKTLCCWCCKSGPISVEFSTDRSGYVPGEWILINATLKNQSNSDVRSTAVHLIQTVTYHATTKTKIVSNRMATITGDACAKRSTVRWTNKKLHIPPIPPSESTHCRIIDIAYFVQFEGSLRTCAVNLRENESITIGTIPLRNLEMYRSPPPTDAMPTPSAPSIANEPLPHSITTGVAGPPPPTYAAAVGGGFSIKDEDDNEHTMGDATYTPQYTYYDWNQSAFTYN